MTQPPIPARMLRRPVDSRRDLPIPYVNQHDDGTVEFSVVDGRMAARCALRQLCSACGQRLGRHLAFVGGLRSFQSRFYTDPPMHPDCANYALTACPYLARQTMRPRPDTADTVVPGLAGLDKSLPILLGVTGGCRADNLDLGGGLTVAFRPAAWEHAEQYGYTGGRLRRITTATGPAVDDLITRLQGAYGD